MGLADAEAAHIVDVVTRLVDDGVRRVAVLNDRQEEERHDTIRSYEDISLVRKPSGETLFVLWIVVAAKKGRKISLDLHTNRIISIVLANVKEKSYADCDVLIPRAAGKRVKGQV